MKFFHKKNVIILLVVSIITLNVVTVFLWQFAYAADEGIHTVGGTLTSSSTLESIITIFGGVDAVDVIDNSDHYKVIVKSDIVLSGSINITSGNYIIVTDSENRTIKRNTADANDDGIFDFDDSLFNVTGGSLSFGDGTANMGITNVSYDDLIKNNMSGTLTITGSNTIDGGYINDLTGYVTVPSVISNSSLINVTNGTINIWPGVNIGNNYGTNSCVNISSSSIFNMYGGKISKCVINDDDSTGGSAININSASSFYMYDGTISDNEASGNNIVGGAVNGTNSNIYIYNGKITNNIDSNNSSGLAINNSNLNMYGGFIYDNIGSDLYLSTLSIATLNNGYIDKLSSVSLDSIINYYNGMINNQLSSNVGTVNYDSVNPHYEIIIPSSSTIIDADYVEIYDENNNLITYYEGEAFSSLTDLKFYLENGNYHAVINERKTYYFSVSSANKTLSLSGVGSTDLTFGFNNDGTITGLTNLMEISGDAEEYFELEEGTYPIWPDLPIGTYYVREIGQTDYVSVTIKGTTRINGGTLTSSLSQSQVETIFGGSENVTVVANNGKYTIILKQNLYINGTITIASGDYNIISDGGDYTIIRNISSGFILDMFKVTGGTLTFGSSNISNDTTNSIKYSFKNEEINDTITSTMPSRTVTYLKNINVLVGIKNTMEGSITIDGGSTITGGYINNSGNGPSTVTNPVAGVLINITGGTVNINDNITLTNNYNSSTTIDGSAIYVGTNGTLKMYGGLITKCVRYNTSNTNGSAIYSDGIVYIYDAEISYNEINSSAIARGTIYLNQGQIYITNIYMHHNWSKGYGGGIFATNNSKINLYQGIVNSNISFNYINTTSNTYSNIINDDIYLDSGSNTLNIYSGTYGNILINGEDIVTITEASINDISINSDNNKVVLYPLVTLQNDLNVPNNMNDINSSVSSSFNFVHALDNSKAIFNSDSTFQLYYYHEYDNTSSYQRSLSFSTDLPINTSIILRRVRGNVITNYYYKNNTVISANTPIYLTAFKKLGTDTSFVEAESVSSNAETIDLIVNFEYAGTISSGKITYSCGDSFATATYIIDDSDEFALNDFSVDNRGKITGGVIVAKPAANSNFYFEKERVLVLTLNNGTDNIPFIVIDGNTRYTPIGNIVNVSKDSLDSLIIKNIDGMNLPVGTYTLTARLSMTNDIRSIKYSTLDGVIITKTYEFSIIDESKYGLAINSSTKILNIDEINNGIFSFNIVSSNLNNGSYEILAYKKTGNLIYNETAESNWSVSENDSVLTINIPTDTASGTYKVVINYLVDNQIVVTSENSFIINNN